MEDEPKKLTKGLEAADQEIAAEKIAPHVKQEGEVRTYASDIADMMRREKGSILKIALAEQKRQREFQKKMDPTTTKNIVVIIIGIVLIVGGIMVFISSIMNRAKSVTPVSSATALPSFMFTENQAEINITGINRTELIQAIHAQVANPTVVPGSINNLYISYVTSAGKGQLPAATFFQKLGIEIPSELFGILYPPFMLGTYAAPDENELFMLVRVKDFNAAFLAFRGWEDTMLSDFLRLFQIDTSSYGRVIFNKEFVTETLMNKEARLLKDSTGKVLLSYIFLDDKTIMITTKTDGLEEIIKRLNLQTIR